MKTNLAEIVLQNIEFFSLAPESEIDPDVAVRQLESIASLIKELPETELGTFIEQVGIHVEKLRRDGAPQEQLSVMENIREHLGI